MSGVNAPENKIEKKLRNAKEILFKMLLFYLAEVDCIAVVYVVCVMAKSLRLTPALDAG